MKLKFLLPASILATASCVSPLALTSCTSDTMYIYDLSAEDYSPSVEPYGADDALHTMTEATQLYVKQVKEYANIFTDDLCYYYNQVIYNTNAPTTTNAKPTIKKFDVSISTPKFGTAKVEYPGEAPIVYPTISFRVKLDINYEATMSDGILRKKIQMTGSFDEEYKDVIFYAYPNPHPVHNPGEQMKNAWMIGCFDGASANTGETMYAHLYNSNPWYMNINYKLEKRMEVTNLSEGTTESTTSHEEYNENIDTYSKLTRAVELSKNASSMLRYALGFDFQSSYLRNLNILPELSIRHLESDDAWTADETNFKFTNIDFSECVYVTNPAATSLTDLKVDFKNPIELGFSYYDNKGTEYTSTMELKPIDGKNMYHYQNDGSGINVEPSLFGSVSFGTKGNYDAFKAYVKQQRINSLKLRLPSRGYSLDYKYTLPGSEEKSTTGWGLLDSPIVYWDLTPILK